jgi:hypothetical protein
MKCLPHIRGPHLHWERFFSKYFSFPVSVSFYQCSICICSSITDAINFGNWQFWHGSGNLLPTSISEQWVWSEIRPCGICGGQSGTVHVAKTVCDEFWRVEFSADFLTVSLKFHALFWGHQGQVPWMLRMTSPGPSLCILVPPLGYNNQHKMLVINEGYHMVVTTSIHVNIMAR